MKSLYDQAHERIEGMKFTSRQMEFIFADWFEGDTHYQWLLTATRREIYEWIIAGDPDLESSGKAAAQLGSRGGASKSPEKSAASRENGKKGGRPRKPQAPDHA
jgi:hypothetical protein